MTVYLKTGVNQLIQAVANFHPEDRPLLLTGCLISVAHFHPENRPSLLLTGCLISGWAASAKIVDYISRTHPFIEQIKIPLSIAGSFAVAGLSYFRPKTAVATMVIPSIVAFALNTYAPEQFKKLLLKGYKFPPNVTVIGNLDLRESAITSLFPDVLAVYGDLGLRQSVITSRPVRFVVHGNLNLFGNITSRPVRLGVRRNRIEKAQLKAY